MRRPEFIARQGRCPSGWLGKFVASIMAKETAPENAVAVSHLDLRPADTALVIGFGHGRVVAELARRCHEGLVCGLDASETMHQMATRANRAAIARGLPFVRLQIPHGTGGSDAA